MKIPKKIIDGSHEQFHKFIMGERECKNNVFFYPHQIKPGLSPASLQKNFFLEDEEHPYFFVKECIPTQKSLHKESSKDSSSSIISPPFLSAGSEYSPSHLRLSGTNNKKSGFKTTPATYILQNYGIDVIT